MRNLRYSAYFFPDLLARFGGKTCIAFMRAPKGLEPQNSAKMLTHWVEILSQLLGRNHVFKLFWPQPPSLTQFIWY